MNNIKFHNFLYNIEMEMQLFKKHVNYKLSCTKPNRSLYA